MERILFTLSILLQICLTGCNSSNSNNNSTELLNVNLSIEKVFCKKFKGEIDGKLITLQILRNANSHDGDTVLKGFIEISENEIPFECFGKVIGESNFEFTVYTDDSDNSFELEGTFTSESTISVKFRTAPGLSNNEFEMQEIKDDLLATPINYYKENLEIETDEELLGGMCDSFLAYSNINTLTFSSTSYKVGKLNRLIDESVGFEKNVRENSVAGGGTEDYYTNIFFSEKGFLTVQVFSSLYGCGAAHGSYNYNYVCYDLLKGDTISLLQIIPTNNFKKIELIAKQKFKRKYQKSDDELEDFYLTENFALLRKGLLFMYQPYEMGSFAEGAMSVFIAYKEIGGLLSNNELVNRISHL